MKTVLIVDDNAQLRKYLKAVFTKENMSVLEAADGNECLKVCERFEPSIMLIDMAMPGKNGIDTIKDVREIYKQLKIIAISGSYISNSETDNEEAQKIGANTILPKPVERKVLLNKVKNMLNNN